MSMWHGVKVRRAAAGVFAAVALTVSLTACGSGDDGKEGQGGDSSASAASSHPAQDTPTGGDAAPSPSPSQTLATLQGANGLQLVIQSAVRDQGGFLTISGVIANNTGQVQYAPTAWNGEESQVKQTGRSLAGMTVVDGKEKKRYYVLRDTEGNPLTTTGVSGIPSNQSLPFFAQFPAPPTTTTQVGIELPTMNTATIAIS